MSHVCYYIMVDGNGYDNVHAATPLNVCLCSVIQLNSPTILYVNKSSKRQRTSQQHTTMNSIQFRYETM